jgi:hypothetical protein
VAAKVFVVEKPLQTSRTKKQTRVAQSHYFQETDRQSSPGNSNDYDHSLTLASLFSHTRNETCYDPLHEEVVRVR